MILHKRRLQVTRVEKEGSFSWQILLQVPSNNKLYFINKAVNSLEPQTNQTSTCSQTRTKAHLTLASVPAIDTQTKNCGKQVIFRSTCSSHLPRNPNNICSRRLHQSRSAQELSIRSKMCHLSPNISKMTTMVTFPRSKTKWASDGPKYSKDCGSEINHLQLTIIIISAMMTSFHSRWWPRLASTTTTTKTLKRRRWIS